MSYITDIQNIGELTIDDIIIFLSHSSYVPGRIGIAKNEHWNTEQLFSKQKNNVAHIWRPMAICITKSCQGHWTIQNFHIVQ